jgi:hypothetical protein
MSKIVFPAWLLANVSIYYRILSTTNVIPTPGISYNEFVDRNKISTHAVVEIFPKFFIHH